MGIAIFCGIKPTSDSESKGLLEALCELNACDARYLQIAIPKNYKKNMIFLQNNFIQTKHLKKNMVVSPDFITRRASDLLYAFRGKNKKTVHEYYMDKHKICLRYPGRIIFIFYIK